MKGVIVRLAALVVLVHAGSELRKCCPISEILDATAECVPHNPEDNATVDSEPWQWIPELEIDTDNRTLLALLQNTTIMFGKKPACETVHSDMLLQEMEHYRIFIDNAGNFRLNASKKASLVLEKQFNQWDRPSLDSSYFCLDQVDLKGTLYWAALVCPCGALPCVKKCCHEGHAVDSLTHKCVPLEGDAEDEHGYWRPRLKNNGSSSNLYRLAGAPPHCPGTAFMETTKGSNKQFLLLQDGSLQLSTSKPPLPADMYCGDYMMNESSVEVVFGCRSAEDQPEMMYVLYGAGMVLSAVVMLVTALVSWNIHATNSLHGKLAFSHNCCIMVGFLLLSAIQLNPSKPQHDACVALAFLLQFSFLAAFFWLNVMCIDVSWAFSGFRTRQASALELDRKKFIYFSLYAWGSPIIIFIVTAIMEFVEEIPDTYLKPNFGVNACWFKEKSAAFAYFYGPMAVLLLINFVLFTYTTFKIFKVQRDTHKLYTGMIECHDGSNFKKDKKRLILYSKLFCLMGLTWITEFPGFMALPSTTGMSQMPSNSYEQSSSSPAPSTKCFVC